MNGFTAGSLGFFSYYIPNTTGLDSIRKITQSYKEKKPVPVSEKVKLLFNEVMDDMKLSEEDKQNIQLYTCWRLDFFYAGSIWKKGIFEEFKKAIIGVPQYFNWESLSEEIKQKLLFRSEKLDWSSEHGKNLENSMFISDKAKKFGLAQNLFYVSTFEPLYNATVTSVLSIIAVQYVFIILNLKNLQHERFKGLRYSAAFVSLVFNFTLWLLFKDMYKCRLEGKADEAVAELGKEYIEGGVEYYNSVLEKNMALQHMIPYKGFWAPFSRFGNEQMSLRQKHLPLSGRRDYFKKLLNEEKA
ncbi:UNVERIFIED_CONTAM: hypothetical protein RMT77_017578 [Armadillidium vulgare]